MRAVKDTDCTKDNGQQKNRRTLHPWGRILADRGSRRFAFFGVPSHWHQDSLAEKKKMAEETVRVA